MPRPLKILTITGAFYPKIDGSVIAVANQARSLSARGHSVTILTRGYSSGVRSETWDGIQVERVFQRGFSLPYRFLFSLEQVRLGLKLRKNNHFDVLHAHGFASLFTAELLRLFNSAPVVVTFHGLQRYWVVDRGLSSALKFAFMVPLEGLLARGADRVVAQSVKLKSVLIRLYRLKESKVEVIPNPIDADRFKFHQVKHGSATVLFVGTLGRLYAPDILLRAASQVISRVPNAKFVFAGKGPLMDYSIELSKKLGI